MKPLAIAYIGIIAVIAIASIVLGINAIIPEAKTPKEGWCSTGIVLQDITVYKNCTILREEKITTYARYIDNLPKEQKINYSLTFS